MKTVMYVGLNDKDSKKQEIETSEAENKIYNICFENSDGVTISRTVGVYLHEDGKSKVIENGYKLEFFELAEENQNKIIDLLKTELNQESIGLEIIENVNIKFVK